uniref:Reverse transcriptase domain-containing protein n=1 Tax=Cannabis sativa TaxID=3483 RepID=A0A803QHG9_CANSA
MICLPSIKDEFWIDYRYEHLPEFCFECGILGHPFEHCTMFMERIDNGNDDDLPYRSWLKGAKLPTNGYDRYRTDFSKGNAWPLLTSFDHRAISATFAPATSTVLQEKWRSCFRFQKLGLSDPERKDIISNCWNNSSNIDPIQTVLSNLDVCETSLQKWHFQKYGRMKKNIAESQAKILNKMIITLIPKIKKPQRVHDYRPISLCNVISKLVTKVLIGCFKNVLQHVSAKTQSAFLPNRLITYNILVAFELVNAIKNKIVGRCGIATLKLDMSKAFDQVEWRFIREVMTKIGFSTKWIDLIIGCLTTNTFTFMLNGEITGSLTPTGGVRQSYPLSPYLFLICLEGLSRLLHYEQSVGHLNGFKLTRHAPPISHLLFTDDSLLFCQVNENSCLPIKRVLDVYHRAFGQVLNPKKSIISFSPNTTLVAQVFFHRQLSMPICECHEKYLGLPSYSGIYTVQTSYHLAPSLDDVDDCSNSSSKSPWWKFFWSLQLPQKIKIFTWCFFNGALPVATALVKRKVITDSTCSICHQAWEIVGHALFGYKYAKAVWRFSNFSFDWLKASSMHKGAVICDSTSMVLAAFSKQLIGSFDPHEMEALAMFHGVHYALQLQLPQLQIETDALRVKIALCKLFAAFSTFQDIIMDISNLLSFFPNVNVSHVKRTTNIVAHSLVKFALGVDGDYF